MKNLRKWSRILHRDIGFFFIGTTLIYAISGIALNHLSDWNPNYSVENKNFTTQINLENNASVKNINPVSDSELSKYSSADLPEECRLPEGQDVNSWKEHLGHHQNTFYCLDYYKDIK